MDNEIRLRKSLVKNATKTKINTEPKKETKKKDVGEKHVQGNEGTRDFLLG